jgi:hypothetical protein
MANEKPAEFKQTAVGPHLLELHITREPGGSFRVNATIGFLVGDRAVPTQTSFSSLETDADVAKTTGTLVAFVEQAAYNACSTAVKK